MMKQPADNANATTEEVRSALEVAQPLPRDPDHDEIAAVAKQLWETRGGELRFSRERLVRSGGHCPSQKGRHGRNVRYRKHLSRFRVLFNRYGCFAEWPGITVEGA